MPNEEPNPHRHQEREQEGEDDEFSPEDAPVPIVVAFRVKPNPENLPTSVHVNPNQNVISLDLQGQGQVGGETAGSITETFNYVFSESASQEAIYGQMISQFVPIILDGYDVSVMSYGQSGGGKTHTLFGSDLPCAMNESDFGLAIRLVRDLFKDLEKNAVDFSVRVSFVDIEDDEMRDILAQSPPLDVPRVEQVQVKDQFGDAFWKTEIRGVNVIECPTISDVIVCLENGLSMHKLQMDSSAEALQELAGGTHSVFSVQIHQTLEIRGSKKVTNSTVRFIDLAGSDKIRVNRGLLSLDNMISAMGDARRHAKRPQFDTTLTRLLSSSFWGSSLSVVLCCVSSLGLDAHETENTLTFAQRAANICNDPKPHVSLVPLNNLNDDRRDSDLSQQHRSVSQNHGNLAQMHPNLYHQPTPPSNTSNSSLNNQNGGHIPLPATTFQQQQPNLTAPPTLDPNILLNYQFQQFLLQQQIMSPYLQQMVHPQLAQHFPHHQQTPPMMTPHQIPTQFGMQQLHHQLPTGSPLSQTRSPFGLHMYWPTQQQANGLNNNSDFSPGHNPILMSPPDDDLASIPLNLSSREVEGVENNMLNGDDDEVGHKSEDHLLLRKKLASILEESENTATSSLSSLVETVQDPDSSSEENSDSSYSQEEDLNSECSQDSTYIEDEDDSSSRDTDILKFKETTAQEMKAFIEQVGRDLLSRNVDEIVEGAAKMNIQEFEQNANLNLSSSSKDKGEAHKDPSHVQAELEEQQRALLKKSLTLDLKEKSLNEDRETLDKLKKSYESKLHSLQVKSTRESGKEISESVDNIGWREQCGTLRQLKEELLEKRAVLESESDKMKNLIAHSETNDQPELFQEVKRNEKERTELDEIIAIIDNAIELKCNLMQNVKLNFDTNKPYLDSRYKDILRSLSGAECAAHIHSLISRVIDLRMEGWTAGKLYEDLEFEYKGLRQAYKRLKKDYVYQGYDIQKIQKEQKVKIDHLQKKIDEYQETNKLLTKFYRRHQSSTTSRVCPNCRGNENPDEIREAPIQARAEKQVSISSKKQTAKIKDQKLIIERHK